MFHSGYRVKGKNPFTRSLKSEYQPCGYVPVQASDAGESARTGYHDTYYRLPTRQMGWPTLGCNQQDPWKTSERLVSRKPACMVPKCWGAGSKYSMKRII